MRNTVDNVVIRPQTRDDLLSRLAIFVGLGLGAVSYRGPGAAAGPNPLRNPGPIRDALDRRLSRQALSNAGLMKGEMILPEGWHQYGRVLLEGGRAVGALTTLTALRLSPSAELSFSVDAFDLAYDVVAELGVPGLEGRPAPVPAVVRFRDALRAAPPSARRGTVLPPRLTELLAAMLLRVEAGSGSRLGSSATALARNYWRDPRRRRLLANVEAWTAAEALLGPAAWAAGALARLYDVARAQTGAPVRAISCRAMEMGLNLVGQLGIPWIGAATLPAMLDGVGQQPICRSATDHFRAAMASKAPPLPPECLRPPSFASSSAA